MVTGFGVYINWLERWAAFYSADLLAGVTHFAADAGIDSSADVVLRRIGLDADLLLTGGYDDCLSGNQPRWAGYCRDYRGREPGRYGFCDGDADVAFVHYFADWPSDGAVYLQPRHTGINVIYVGYTKHLM
ncbi:hypothetical protein D3C84_891000 [compost metagenome]